MKAHKKTTKVTAPEEPLHTGKRKKISKPWVKEYMILKKESVPDFFMRGKELNTWYEDTWYKYISVEHATQQLEKELRTFIGASSHWRFINKDFRLKNIETGEIVNLEIKNNLVKIVEDDTR